MVCAFGNIYQIQADRVGNIFKGVIGMKRVLSLFLCLALLLSSVALLSSCSKTEDGVPKVSKKVLDVDLSNYNVVYGYDFTTATAKNEVNKLVQQLNALTTLKMTSIQDNATEELETADCEILIGNTLRTETTKTLSGIKGLGWAIRVFENKIVIVGTTNFMTLVALSYFTENFLNTEAIKEAKLSVNEKIVASKMDTVTLLEENGDSITGYTLVFDDRLDDVTGSNSKDWPRQYGTEPAGDTTDYPVTLCNNMKAVLNKATGAKGNVFALKDDSVEASDREILVGSMDRTEMKEVLAGLAVTEYALVIKNGRIMVAGWNDTTLASAYMLFEAMINESAVEDEEGNITLLIPANCTIKGAIAGTWVTDFPRPELEGVALSGTVDVGNNSLEYVYTGDGITRENYVAYCQQLEAAGYELYSPETQLEGSSFRTYVDRNSTTTLRVSHYAYAHAEAQKIDMFEKCFRIVASTTDSVTLPNKLVLDDKQSYTYLTAPMITSLELNHAAAAFGLSYAITLEDGSFILFDGGGINFESDNAQSESYDYQAMYNVLLNLYRKVRNDPTAIPTENDPIHIRAWILTHEHQDHYRTMELFLKNFGKNKNLRFDQLFANFASDTELVNVYNPNTSVGKGIKTLQGYVNGGFDYVKVHTGDTFYLANAKLEVLYTHEDIYPQRLEYFNNTSTIFRITLDSTNGQFVTEARSSCIWLGDLERIGGYCMTAMYGESLAGVNFAKTFKDNVPLTSMVQVAHHGYNGVAAQLYELINAEVVWVPAPKNTYKNYTNATSTNWSVQANYAAANAPNVKLVVMADDYHTTLIINENGPQYDKLFDACHNEGTQHQGNTGYGNPVPFSSDCVVNKGAVPAA